MNGSHGINIDGNYVVQRFMTEMRFNIGANGYSKFKNGLLKLASAVEKMLILAITMLL
jgi:hypothetical protein